MKASLDMLEREGIHSKYLDLKEGDEVVECDLIIIEESLLIRTPHVSWVESLSGNVKMGLQMKMKRGELVGFNGCFGYDYHQDTKTITVNETEAETVRLIYDMYLQNWQWYDCQRLVELRFKNKRGTVEWHDHGVMGMIKNRSIR